MALISRATVPVLRVPGTSLNDEVFIPPSQARLAFLSRKLSALGCKPNRTSTEQAQFLFLIERYCIARDEL